ncbi:MAG: hypothetical protein Q8Q32_03490 [bacterium]|nr:hypothetical protein [bacterium]
MPYGPFVHEDIHFFVEDLSVHMGLCALPIANRNCDRWILTPDDPWVSRRQLIGVAMRMPLPPNTQITLGVSPSSSESQVVLLQGQDEEVVRPATMQALRTYWDGQEIATFKHQKAKRRIIQLLEGLRAFSRAVGFARGNGIAINY